MADNNKEKLKKVLDAINDLEGEPIPFNIIKHSIIPLKEWLETELNS
jgi:hypothetical protein